MPLYNEKKQKARFSINIRGERRRGQGRYEKEKPRSKSFKRKSNFFLISKLYKEKVITSEEKYLLKKEIIRKDLPLLHIFKNYFSTNNEKEMKQELFSYIQNKMNDK